MIPRTKESVSAFVPAIVCIFIYSREKFRITFCLTCFNNMSSMRMQQDKFSSAFVVNSICLGVGAISSESGVDLPESFSTTGPVCEHFA